MTNRGFEKKSNREILEEVGKGIGPADEVQAQLIFTDRLIKAFDKSSNSQEKYSKAMFWLTIALIIVPFISLFLTLSKDTNFQMTFILGIISIILVTGVIIFTNAARNTIFGKDGK